MIFEGTRGLQLHPQPLFCRFRTHGDRQGVCGRNSCHSCNRQVVLEVTARTLPVLEGGSFELSGLVLGASVGLEYAWDCQGGEVCVLMMMRL